MKKNIKAIGDCIMQSLSRMIEKLNAEKQAVMEANWRRYILEISEEIHLALGDILSHTSISPCVSGISSFEDILFHKFKIVGNNNVFFYYSIPKVGFEPLSPIIVNRITENINRAINSRISQMNYTISTLDGQSRTDFYMMNRLYFVGFRIVGSRDDFDRIMIAVALN